MRAMRRSLGRRPIPEPEATAALAPLHDGSADHDRAAAQEPRDEQPQLPGSEPHRRVAQGRRIATVKHQRDARHHESGEADERENQENEYRGYQPAHSLSVPAGRCATGGPG